MNWNAVVPFKTSGERKSRLADLLSADERAVLSGRMFRHVVDVLADIPAIGRIVVLADRRPTGWDGDWIADTGRGLNVELEAARATVGGDMIMLHADLPLIAGDDVTTLIEAAETHDMAIAPDRHGTGTNGLALKAGTVLNLTFGINSFPQHCRQYPDCAVICRDGFALDLDTPDDWKALEAAGWR